jgi:hypothetical protein
MWQFFETVIKSVPSWFIMSLIVVLIGFAIYVIPRLRRDKQGKWYIFNRAYENSKAHLKEVKSHTTEMHARFDDMCESVKNVQLEVLKLSVFTEELPLAVRMASGIRFVKCGGNGETKEYLMKELMPQNQELYDGLFRVIGEKGGSAIK